MRWKLVIFDFDGTLADSADWFLRNLNPAADRFGFRRIDDEAELASLRRLPNREIIRRLRVPMWQLPRIARHLRAQSAREAATIRLFDGIGPMLAALRARGLALAIVSSNSEANIRAILGPDLAALIDHYECGAALFGKAARLRKVARRARLAPAEAIAIGDESRDIDAARAAGMASAAVAWGYADPALLADCAPTLAIAAVSEITARLAG
jgi:phosphoglycolate phosphatase